MNEILPPWLPMDTAPKTGEEILGAFQGVDAPYYGVMSWMAPVGYCEHWAVNQRWTPTDPLAWMPISEFGKATPDVDHAELIRVLRPFAQPDLSTIRSGNTRGDESPVFMRNDSVLTIGDFRAVIEFLKKLGVDL